MAGALDLYAGASATGVNNFGVDHSPLDQLGWGTGLADVDIDLLEVVQQWLVDVVGPAFQNLTGLVINGANGVADFLQSLLNLLGDITVDIMSIFEQLSVQTGLNFLDGPGPFFTSLMELLGDLGGQIGLAVEDVLGIIAKVLSAPAEILGQGIAGVSDWVLDTIFGLVAPDRIPILPIGHLIFDRVNLLTNPQFTDLAIQTLLQGDWWLDEDVTHSNVGRSARIDADGTENTLFSVDLIPVHGLSPTNAQQMHIEAWVKTKGFVGPPGCVRISLAKYKTVDGSDTPTYEDLCLPTQFGDTDWRQWTEDWIVEPGVVAVRYVITVSEEATGGQIWFDDLFLGKNGLLNANWVDGLEQLFGDFAQLASDFAAQVWATLEDVAEAVGGAIADLIESIVGPSAFDTLEEWVANVNGLGQVIADVVNGIGAAITDGITNFVETVFGGFNFDTFEEFIASVLESLKPENIFDGIKDFIEDLLNGLVAGFATLQNVADQITAGFTAFVENIFGGVDGFNTFEEFIASVLESLKPENIFDGIKDTIDGLIGGAVAGLASLGDVATAIANSVGDFIDAVIAWIEDKTGIDLSAPLNFFTTFATGLNNSPVQLSHLDVTMPGFPNVGAGVTNAINNIENTWEQWMIALTGAGSSAQDIGAASGAELTAGQIEQLIATTMANNTMLANLQASLTATGTAGISGGDDFEIGTTATLITTEALWGSRGWDEQKFNITTGVTLPAGAAANAAGRFQITDRHQADWVGGGINQGARYFRDAAAADAKTLTPYQKITRVTGSKIAQIFLGGEGTDLLYGRVNAAGNEYVVAGFNRDGVYLKYRKVGFNGGNGVGAETGIVASAPCPAPTVGCSYTLECGTNEGVNVYRVLRNGAVVLRWDGSAAGISSDESHRYWGWGGITGSALLGSTALIPSSINSVTVADNAPSPYVGTYLRAYRSTPTKIDKPAGAAPLADNTLDAAASSTDLIFDKATQEIVVLKAGPLNVTARLELDEDIQGTERWDLLLYKRAKGDATRTLFARGAHTAGTDGLTTNPVARAISGSFSVYCNAGDVLELGLDNSTVAAIPASQKGVIGDAAGTKSWFTITRGG